MDLSEDQKQAVARVFETSIASMDKSQTHAVIEREERAMMVGSAVLTAIGVSEEDVDEIVSIAEVMRMNDRMNTRRR